MRYRDSRPTLLKHIDTFEPIEGVEYQPTPRWISPDASGFYIAKGLGKLDLVSRPVQKFRRRKPRSRLPGVALKEKPWSV